jgi:uncharacterized protein
MMSSDVTPLVPTDRQVIESYFAQGFRVSGVVYSGAILVLPHATQAWSVAHLAEVSLASLAPLRDAGVEILLLGCGRRMGQVPEELRRELRAMGTVLDAMDTGAACRTYTILLAEDRRVAAALLPIG